MDKAKMVAACGLYCDACEMYRAEHDNNTAKVQTLVDSFNKRGGPFSAEDLKCDGCRVGGRLILWCRQCAIRDCTKKKSPDLLCSDCPEFPCSTITAFNNDGMQHHTEVLENLRHIQEMGLEKWLKYEDERWTCPECRSKLSWYDAACSKCGEKRSSQLFPLNEDHHPLG